MGINSTTRKRIRPVRLPDRESVTTRISTGQVIARFNTPAYMNTRQETTSEGHPFQRLKAKDNTEDIGGDFLTSKIEFEHLSGPKAWSVTRNVLGVNWEVDTVPMITFAPDSVSNSITIGPGNLGHSQIGDKELLVWGTRAIANTIPTEAQASVAVMLGELARDGLPVDPGRSFSERRKSQYRGTSEPRDLTDLKGGSDEFLNYEFGIAPLVRDLAAMAKAVRQSDEILSQMARDNGRRVRRRMSFPSQVDTQQTVQANYRMPTMTSYWYPTTGQLQIETRKSREIWFSGAYTYHYDVPKTFWDQVKARRRELNRLLGLDLTIENVWNLVPWSWLVDWGVNMGDIWKNVSYIGRDGLVLQYGYIMCTDVTEVTHTVSGISDRNGNSVPPVSQRYVCVSKKRLKATPYGFGLNPDSFSAKQWAILAALGITRDGRRLAY